jgi:carboxylesterase type B
LLKITAMVRNRTANREINKNWDYWIPIVFRFVDEPNKVEIAQKIREFYFGNVSTEINEKNLPTLVEFMTDRTFNEGLSHALKLHKGQHPIYPYLYSYQGQFSFGRIMMNMNFNVPVVLDFLISQGKRFVRTKIFRKPDLYNSTTHGDELPLFFNLPFQDITETHPDFELSKTLIYTWTTFAKTG